MSEHPFDRLARRLAGEQDGERPALLVSRRWLLRSTALGVGAAASARLTAAVPSFAAGVSSCDCSSYADRQWEDCVSGYRGTSLPNDGLIAAMQYGIGNTLAFSHCKTVGDDAQAACKTVPCPSGSHCVTLPSGGDPICQGADCPTPGQVKCGDDCVDLQTDSNNCGRCGHACVGSSYCADGKCVGCSPACAAPVPTCCDSAYGPVCVDLTTNLNDCGACGNVCPGEQDCCNGTCTDTSTDVTNCGDCGVVCDAGEVCCSGNCLDPVCCGCNEPAECCVVNGVTTCCPNGCSATILETFVCVS